MIIEVQEMKNMKICYEECREGIVNEWVYVAKLDTDREIIVGWIIKDYDIENIELVFDGMIYPYRLSDYEMKQFLGEDWFQYHKDRALAVMQLTRVMSPNEYLAHMEELRNS